MGWYKSVIAKLASSYEAKIVKIDAETGQKVIRIVKE